ncbi:biotin--[acetyl-CoA-carboxylase] ligase [Subtercola endophyticus]|uniref:biotin--[acetyl-CoA-carboxylase] ligase n=1 Tax=Subtercola endophyticus TaxID=2895559 RepID=UPI001E5A495B|nr:biotin--[acetyl-CoA-carboxylase] ligase [Subtercola endophyticus]UFS57762.1 biotin--[acetyl-CoA-carboxylase] ligase [Subtercola endophyticus]
MNLPLSAAEVPRLDWLAESPSTNPALVEAATGPESASWPDFSVLATDNQTAGKGRLGRVWSAPAGSSLAISVLLRPQPQLPIESLAWLPLVGGVAMAQAVNSVLSASGSEAIATVKWPNDVLIGRAKVSGILAELLPGANGVVLGSGVNLFLTADELPVATATSIALAGGTGFTADDLLSAYLRELKELYTTFVQHAGDAVTSGVAARVTAACSTIGQHVSVELPGGELVTGLATGLDDSGRIVVVKDADALTFAVSAGDVTHLRY